MGFMIKDMGGMRCTQPVKCGKYEKEYSADDDTMCYHKNKVNSCTLAGKVDLGKTKQNLLITTR